MKRRVSVVHGILIASLLLPAALALALDDPTSEDVRQVNSLISRLDDDDFETRNSAAQKLIAYGARVEPLLKLRLKSRPQNNQSAELQHGIERVLVGIQRAADAKELDDATRDFEKIVTEAPLHYLAPASPFDERLMKKISFDMVDTPLDAAVARVAEETNSLLFVDPALQLNGLPAINLRVHDMTGRLALDWLVRLVNCNTVRRGRVTVITDNRRFRKLRMRKEVVELPVAPHEAPWTMAETRALAADLEHWQLPNDPNETARVSVTEAGKIELIGDDELLRAIDVGVRCLGEDPSRNVRFDKPTEDLIAALNRPYPFSVDTSTKLGEAAAELERLTGIEVGGGPIENNPMSEKWSTDGASVFEILEKLGELGNAVAMHAYEDGKHSIRFRALHSEASELFPCVLDLRAAEKAGVAADKLADLLNATFVKNSFSPNSIPAATLVRGRMLLKLDIWSGRHVGKMLDTAAHSGKLPELPSVPEFVSPEPPVPPEAPAAPATPVNPDD